MEDIFNTQSQENESIDIGRYFRSIFSRWWLVALVSLVVLIPWALHIKGQVPVYRAEAFATFERVAGVPQSLIQSRKLLLQSRSFAEEVTAELGLTMEIQQEEGWATITRHDVFKQFSTTSDPVVGSYELRFYPTGYCAFYQEGVLVDSLLDEKCIQAPVSYHGLTFQLLPEIVTLRPRVFFEVNEFRGTVDDLRSREEVKFNREGDLMSVALRHTNPIIAAQTVNMLTDIFIRKSIHMSEDRTKDRLVYLETQLRVAKQDLARIDMELKRFNNVHLMGLDEEKKKTVARLQAFEADTAMIGLYKRDLKQLLGKFDYTNPDFESENLGHHIYRQMATLDAFSGDQAMDLARRRMDDYDEEKEALEALNLPPRNPKMVEINEKISQVETDILDLAQRKLVALDDRLARMKAEIGQELTVLAKLPAEQMAFLALRRQQKVKEDIHSVYLRQVQEAQVSASLAAENVTMLDRAIPIFQPVSGDKKKKVLFGGLAALFLGALVAVMVEVADKRLKTRDDVKRFLQLPLMGVIPKVKFDDTYDMADSEKAKSISSQIVTHDYSPTPVGEAYRSLRTSLLFNKSIGEIKTLAIGSVMPGEGKSFTAANLAITLAQQKSRTLLIDADLRRGVLHNSFNCSKKPGLTNYLTGVVPVENVLNETYIPNLTLITCGSLLPNPSELLGSDRMKRFIESVSQRFDFVIFDTPPLMAATDAIILSTLVDGFAMLVRSGMTNRDDVKRKLELFHNLQANVLGVILNCAGVDVAHEGYSYYRY